MPIAPKNLLVVLVLLLCGTLLAPPAKAHPHVWIDAAVIIHRNDTGQISAIEPVWIFDDLYTASLLTDLDGDASGAVEKHELQKFAKEAIGNLQEWDYFLKAEASDRPAIVYNKEIITDSSVLNNRLLLRFKLELDEPLAQGATLKLKTYDPSFFISIEIIEDKAVSYLPSSAGSCLTKLKDPEDLENQSSSLSDLIFSDEEVAANPDLGAIFAQSLEITC